jgi:LysR family transcriptional regulator, low CO2-responsive transcriptional regulator
MQRIEALLKEEGMSDLPQPVQLQAYLAVVRFGSYTRAAERLGYSEPAVHQQVRALEKTLGLSLIARQGKNVSPTGAGLELLPFAIEADDRLANLSQIARQLRQPGLVRIAAGRRTASVAVMPLVPRFLDVFPDDDVELNIPHPDYLLDGIANGEYDIVVSGMLKDRIAGSDLRRHRMRLVPWKRSDHWVLVSAPRIACHARELKVFHPSYYGIDDSAHRSLIGTLPEPKLVELDTDFSVRHACLSGLGLGLVPIGTVAADINAGHLNLVASDPKATQTCYLLHRHPKLLPPPAVRFLKFLLAHRRDEFATEAPPPSRIAM